MVLDSALLSTQYYKVWIKATMEESKERICTLPNTTVLLLLKREPSGRTRLGWPTYFFLKIDL